MYCLVLIATCAYQIPERVHHDEIDEAKELRQPPAFGSQARALHEGHAVVRYDAVIAQKTVHYLVQRRASNLVDFLRKFL